MSTKPRVIMGCNLLYCDSVIFGSGRWSQPIYYVNALARISHVGESFGKWPNRTKARLWCFITVTKLYNPIKEYNFNAMG